MQIPRRRGKQGLGMTGGSGEEERTLREYEKEIIPQFAKK